MALTPIQVTTLTNWVNGGGNLIALRPDKQLAGPARPDRRRDDAGERVPGGQHRDRSRRRDRRADDPVPRHRRPVHAERRDGDRDALLERVDGDRQPCGHAPLGRFERRPGGGVHLRPQPLDRLHAPGEPRVGGAEPRRRRRLAPERHVLRGRRGRRRSPTGSTPTRSDPPGRRAAAAAREPDPPDEPRQDAATALLVPAADEKAALVMTGDDHATGGTAGRFDTYIADSPPGCSVANWDCVRSTSYVYAEQPADECAGGRRTSARDSRSRSIRASTTAASRGRRESSTRSTTRRS